MLRQSSVYITTGLELAPVPEMFFFRFPVWFLICLVLTIAYVGFGTFVSIPPAMEHPDFDDREPRESRRDRHSEDEGYGEDGYGGRKADDGGFKPATP